MTFQANRELVNDAMEVLKEKNLSLYTIVEDSVRFAYLLPSKSDYMKLFKTKSRYD